MESVDVSWVIQSYYDSCKIIIFNFCIPYALTSLHATFSWQQEPSIFLICLSVCLSIYPIYPSWVWTHEFLIFQWFTVNNLWANCPKFSQEKSFQTCTCVLVICFYHFFFLSIFLPSHITHCFRLTLYLPCVSPGINYHYFWSKWLLYTQVSSRKRQLQPQGRGLWVFCDINRVVK